MPEWTCPECGGGFPEPEKSLRRVKKCPWCKTELGSVETNNPHEVSHDVATGE